MSDISKTLVERHTQHGNFVEQAEISQALSEVMHRATNYRLLTPYQRESLEMIQHKIARILEGDRNHIDHWHDIAGYSTLVERHLRQERERLTAQAFVSIKQESADLRAEVDRHLRQEHERQAAQAAEYPRHGDR
jgi:hypothetical protein